jgi:class 3 adenylate cyclase
MTTRTWKYNTAKERLSKSIDSVKTVTVVDYVKDMSLENIPKNKAYRMDAVHLYADILNLDEMLTSTDVEGETCHKRTLRFLDLHFRAVHRILAATEARKVDFHNQRLHMFLAKPYNSETGAEAKRIRTAVAIGQLIIDVLAETGDSDESIPNAKVRIGIDSGKALAVNNGRKSNREPLFLGQPANLAAKMSAGSARGIYLTNGARKAIGLEEVNEPKRTALTAEEIAKCQEVADLGVSKDSIVEAWRRDLKSTPIGSFYFSGHTPPLCDLDIGALTPANSRRQDLASIYADIDGFTAYVAEHVESNADDVVRTLAVIREELDQVLSRDFAGRRIRFIGDCIHGILCEGTAQTTDAEKTISNSTLCVGALRSSFELAIELLQAAGVETGSLGLAIGFDYGPTATTRLGMKGARTRCSLSRAVRNSEARQMACTGVQSAIGDNAYNKASKGVKELFGEKKRANNLDYNEAVSALATSDDKAARVARNEAYSSASRPIAESASVVVRPYCAQ